MYAMIRTAVMQIVLLMLIVFLGGCFGLSVSQEAAESAKLSEIRRAIRLQAMCDAGRYSGGGPVLDWLRHGEPALEWLELVPLYAAEFIERSRRGRHVSMMNREIGQILPPGGYVEDALQISLVTKDERELLRWSGLSLDDFGLSPFIDREAVEGTAGLRIQLRARVVGRGYHHLLADIPLFPLPGGDELEELRSAIRLEAADFSFGSGIARDDRELARLLAHPNWQDRSIEIDELVPLYARQILELSWRNTLFVISDNEPKMARLRMPDAFESRGLQLALIDANEQTLAKWWGFRLESQDTDPEPRVPRANIEGVAGLRIQMRAPSSDGDELRLVADLPLFPWVVE